MRERAWTEKDGDLKTLKKLLHESFKADPASKVCNMSDSKVTTWFVAILMFYDLEHSNILYWYIFLLQIYIFESQEAKWFYSTS